MNKAQLIVWLALPLALTAADTQRIDLTECAKAQDSKRERWLFGALPGGGGAKVMNESGFFPVTIREAGDCSQLYALLFYAARRKHSALRAPCSQRFTSESVSKRPTLMPESSNFCLFTTMRKQESLKTPAKCNLA